MVSEATNESTLTLDPLTVLALLQEYIIETTRVNASHTTLCLKYTDVPRGAIRKCKLRGSARRIFNQIQMDTISLSAFEMETFFFTLK